MKLSRKRTRTQTLKLPASTPRNPLVAAALQRKAGAHRKSNKALRRGLRSSLLGVRSSFDANATQLDLTPIHT